MLTKWSCAGEKVRKHCCRECTNFRFQVRKHYFSMLPHVINESKVMQKKVGFFIYETT